MIRLRPGLDLATQAAAQMTVELLKEVGRDLESCDFDALERAMPRGDDDLVAVAIGNELIAAGRALARALEAASQD